MLNKDVHLMILLKIVKTNPLVLTLPLELVTYVMVTKKLVIPTQIVPTVLKPEIWDVKTFPLELVAHSTTSL